MSLFLLNLCPPLPKQKKKKEKEKKRQENFFGTKDSCILVTLIRLFTRVTSLSNSPKIRMLVDLKFRTTNDVNKFYSYTL